jgi:V/A-type H+-transporting ATPase subunit D
VALKFQFNKTALAQLKKELKVRQRALPTLKAKETALRLEVKKAKEELVAAQKVFAAHRETLSKFGKLWEEFPDDILQIKGVETSFKKIAGVKIPVLGDVNFVLTFDSFFGMSGWTAAGINCSKSPLVWR